MIACIIQPMLRYGRFLVGLAFLSAVGSAFAQQAQDNARPRVVFLAGKPSHGYGAHEHLAGCRILAEAIERSTNQAIQCEVYAGGWPEDDHVLDGAATIVMYADGGGGHPVLPHLARMAELMERGIGLVSLHYAVEVPKDNGGAEFLEWLGGYFETHWSVNPHWLADFQTLPDHPIARGVTPFKAQDEWYFHMRFRAEMNGVTPILSAVAPHDTMVRRDGPHSGNPFVRQSVERGDLQHTAWAFERPNGGRSFGFTGGHFHWNWGREEMLRVVCNAILWTAQIEVPESGLPVRRPRLEKLEADQDYPKPADFQREAIQEAFRIESDGIESMQQTVLRDPQNAVSGLLAHDGVIATLSASEPQLCSLTNLDIDHRGRVWVCEVMNYRGFAGRRPEGDRILILQDGDGDGVMDSCKVFYQGPDIDSAMGICVLGNRVIVSASPNVWIFTDEDGDDIPDKKELLFSQTGIAQHDHSAHSFVFGPDGKLYWNFGNTGHAVHDAAGNLIVDLAGNLIRDDGRPYREGMVFRCDLDGSNFEVLGHNFRNNYEVAVDSFGNLWQSDNDDDGNQAVRINFVIEFGNYGYRDELTGAGWQVPRNNREAEIPRRHWHLNDPGVVPTMLLTGAGSPAGIMVYEGDLLPSRFRNQVIHCDPGPSAVRAYPVSISGAGFLASIENLLTARTDNWFRPVDVCAAPDGSLFVTDWHDPGVGGHHVVDLDRGRLFRIAPLNSKYQVPSFDFSTPAGAVAALQSPNGSTRFLAWQAIQTLGDACLTELQTLANHDNPRIRARALWAWGKLPGYALDAVKAAIRDAEPDVRCVAVRLARQTGVGLDVCFEYLIGDFSAAVRRELAVALRFDKSADMPQQWARLAAQHDEQDRWYLEALGIGAELRWDDCWTAYVDWQTLNAQPVSADIVWRARSRLALPYVVDFLSEPVVELPQVARMLRALDFHEGENRVAALTGALEAILELNRWCDGHDLVIVQAVLAASNAQRLLRDSRVDAALRRQMVELDRRAQVDVLRKVRWEDVESRLIEIAKHTDTAGTSAASLLIRRFPSGEWLSVLRGEDESSAVSLATTIAAVNPRVSIEVLLTILQDETMIGPARIAAAKGLAKSDEGAAKLLELESSGELFSECRLIVGSLLANRESETIRQRAAELLPMPKSRETQALPSLTELVQRRGNAELGESIYRTTGTCSKCHPLGGGVMVGPDLSQIGSKLAREALYVSILDPSAGISHSYETYAALTVDGQMIAGLMVSQTENEIVLRDAEGIERTIDRGEIEEFKQLKKSLMPDNIVESLSTDDLVNLVEYLTTLR